MKRKLCFIITFSLLLCIFCLPAYADPVSTPDNVSVLRFSSTRFVEYKFEIGQNGDAYIGASIVPIDRSHSCKIVATVQSKVNGKWKNIYSTSAQGDGIALLEDTSQTFSVGGTYCCVYDFYVYDGNTLLEHITQEQNHNNVNKEPLLEALCLQIAIRPLYIKRRDNLLQKGV